MTKNNESRNNEARNRKLSQGNTINFKNSENSMQPSSFSPNDNNENDTAAGGPDGYSELYNPATRELLKRRDSMLSINNLVRKSSIDSTADIDEIRKSVASRNNSVSRSRRASVISTRKSIKREKIRRKSVAVPNQMNIDFGNAPLEGDSGDDFCVNSEVAVKVVEENDWKTKIKSKMCCIQ